MKSFSLICDVCGTVNRMNQTHCLACGQVLAVSGSSAGLTSAPTVSSLSHTLLKQRYRVMHVVGKGGMGTVYIGVDTQLGNRLVAIKEMSQNGLSLAERQEAAKNFQHEAHLLAGLQHPNLPSIYDHFEEGQRWYLIMSFIKGQTLSDYLETRGGQLSVEEVLEIGIALCSVLNYLHSCQPPIIFRDLKPSNIMRTVDGHIYLIDFGIARFFKPGKIVDTAHQGSSGYASPEQYGTAQTTPRSDIYSLGATFYYLLSGYELAYTPFHMPPLQSLVPSIPASLATLVTRMLALDEKARPDNVEMVKAELQKIIYELDPFARSGPLPGSQPPASRPSSPLAGRSLFARSKWWVLAGSLAVLIALGGIILCVALSNASANDTSTPAGVVNVFCKALNAEFPDFQTAYSQLSSHYQHGHSLIAFQEYLLGTSQCTVSSPPNQNGQAEVSLTLRCPPPPPDLNLPPPREPPPPRISPVDLTLIKDGASGWKIDTVYLVGRNCGPPPGTSTRF